MTLHMLKLEPKMDRLVRWAGNRGLLPQRGEDDLGYALHALLTAAFGEFAPKPFALQRDPKRPAALLAYSAHDPAALREHAASFAEPDVTAALGVADMATKPMPDRFPASRRLGFTEIAALVETVLDRIGRQAADSLEAVLHLDGLARRAAEGVVRARAA